ncbi:MAG: DUF3084 domain-containing protein [Candidatus Eremiobacteraeota bacterium]|nr:DUF3084 domain-containing protein [Candidatus Eremiobacteraeota bacterium]
MIANLSGIALVVAITIVAGGIAYIGDRVGHQVGRKRLTLFGLRPKYTSTIVAVATGMLIALSVTSVALIGSQQVRTAFFRLGQINARINDLQAQAIATQRELEGTRDRQFVVSIGYPIGNNVLTTRLSQADAVVLAQLSSFFDNTVRAANAQFAHAPYDLKPYRKTSTDPEIQALLKQQLATDRGFFPTDVPVLYLPLIGQNLFKGDVVSFRLKPYADVRVAAAGDVLASVDVQGGRAADSLVLPLQRLTTAAISEMEGRGMPAVFAINPAPSNNVQEVVNQITRLRGNYRLVAKAGLDMYPHSGGILLDYSLVAR